MHTVNVAGAIAYLPDGTPLAQNALKKLVADRRPCYRMNDTGMVYDVRKAQQIVRKEPRDYVYLPVRNHPQDTTLDLSNVLATDHNKPGIIFFVFNALGNPEYQLMDGNHRVERCRYYGIPIFRAFPLDPDEAKACEWFVLADQPCPPQRYRWFDQDGSEDYAARRRL